MPAFRRIRRTPALTLALVTALAWAGPPARGDTIVLKNGAVYRGKVDRDKPLLWVYDGLKRVVLYDSKVARIESDAALDNLEGFTIEQPLVVHGGSMPREVISVTASPWNDRGRRSFAYEGSRVGKVIRMEQAINWIDPHKVKLRGVDGFWLGQLSTSQVPREVVLGILAKVDRQDRKERIRVVRFLIQAGWYPEARAELDRVARDFPGDPDLRERISLARDSVGQLEAAQLKAEIDRCKTARRPADASALLKAFPLKNVTADLEVQVRELQRTDEAQAAADKAVAEELSALHKRLFSGGESPKDPEPVGEGTTKARSKTEPPDRLKADPAGRSTLKADRKGKPAKRVKVEWEDEVKEVLEALRDAPDAVRDRFVAWQKAKADGAKPSDAAQFALAMSGYVVGADAAVAELATARTLWTMRGPVRDYLRGRDAADRGAIVARLEALSLPAAEGESLAVKKLDTVTRLAVRMPPPLHDEEYQSQARGSRTLRVQGDDNEVPTEYAVSLPPEYNPLRSYPAVVALHDGTGPQAAIAWWSAEAARHGYVVIAPEYKLPGQGKEYKYTESEHAAIELSLRDARRRFAIDGDRVFVAGQLVGANAAWDFGLAHPDLFAGVVVVSGFPFKYVNRYLPHTKRLPLYVTLGDLAPASNEVVFGQVLKPMIAEAWDVTYTEYFRRGLEDLPEEAPFVFDWMDRRRRDPYPKSFEVVSARACDNRFFGVVVREFAPGRTTAPEAVEPNAKNLKPATIKVDSSKLSNLLRLQTVGASRLDVWVSPGLIDFKKRMEVRVNGRARFKGLAKPDLMQLLEDLRVRGDRQQIYWMKVPVG